MTPPPDIAAKCLALAGLSPVESARYQPGHSNVPAVSSRLTVTAQVPWLCPLSEPNTRSHWAVALRRRSKYKAYTWGALRRFQGFGWAFPVLVTFTRHGMRLLDDDNLAGAYKAVRDVVAEVLGVDDGDTERVRWAYRQEAVKRADTRTTITIEEVMG